MTISRRIGPPAILAVGFGAFLLYAFPGYMSIDSCQQLLEARSHVYSDWHPPAMAALWRLVEHVVTGPFGMLLLQSGAFLAGSYRLLLRLFTPRTAALFAAGLLLFPPILAPMAVIWKDSQMAGYLVLGFALMLDERPRTRWVGVVILAIASAMRANAAAATLPLFAIGFVWRPGQAWWRRLAVALGVWAAITVAAFGVDRALTDNPSHAWHTSIATADIAGVLKFSRRYSDEELRTIFEGTPLIAHENIFLNARHHYTPISWWRVVNGPDRLFDWPTTDTQRAALARAWKTLVLANPLAYLDHRAHVFREVLGLSGSPLFDPVDATKVPTSYEDSLHYKPGSSRVQLRVARALTWIATKTFAFRAYVYFAIALLLIPLAWRHREPFALLASGLAYELSLFPFAPSPDVRYSHWLFTTTVLATIMLVAQRARQSPRRSASDQSRTPA